MCARSRDVVRIAGYGAAAPRPGKMQGASVEDEPGGKVDLVAILYIVGGIPALVGFLVLIFWLARACDAPA